MIVLKNIKNYFVSIFAILLFLIANQTVFANEFGQEYPLPQRKSFRLVPLGKRLFVIIIKQYKNE
jgi:hypothetical protein